jgi:hypothetical protein
MECSARLDNRIAGNGALSTETRQLISYIAPTAPATRQPATGSEPFIRPEIGFTPNWFRTATGIDFGLKWHTEPAYRREMLLIIRNEIKRRFPGTSIGGNNNPEKSLDLLTGTYGCVSLAAIYGIPIVYAEDNWPKSERSYLSDNEIDNLEPPNLERNSFFQQLLAQLDWIASNEGPIEGFINFQGVLNNAYRLRGGKIFYDIIDSPQRCRHLFDCICTTMIDAAKLVHKRQLLSGVKVDFFTVSNCMVNMISPEHYRDMLLASDQKIAEAFGCIGIHNCSWNADAYIDDYATIPNLGYIDMGIDSNLTRASEVFTGARRALVYRPTDLVNKSPETIEADLEKIATEYAPCDIVVGDIEADTPDEQILEFLELCDRINNRMENL